MRRRPKYRTIARSFASSAYSFMSLTDHQQEAYDVVYERLASGERFTGLRGYAGTGKTFLVTQLVDQLTSEGCTVTVCAPTHKAVQVLRDQLNGGEVETQTLHSYLGLRLQPDVDGQYVLVPEGMEEERPASVVVCDEASMVGRDEWEYIQASQRNLQWLFVGDPAQLPPVNEDPSPALEVEGPMLEEVHRQSTDNPILDLATKVRRGTAHRFQSRFKDGIGVAITHKREAFLDTVLRTFNSDAFADDATHARLLAYRNRTVRQYNREIRSARYGNDAPRFEEGEWLVARETWFHEGAPVVKNSEELRVTRTSITTFEADDLSEWKVWKLKVRSPYAAFTRTILVLHEDEQERYENDMERLRLRAKEDGSNWAAFYDLRERFAAVDYAYATTVHKAQGSTFDTVFVDHRDLQACRGPEKAALLYVAVTRPARRLALLV
jgi:exodeoxyribonuclease-5